MDLVRLRFGDSNPHIVKFFDDIKTRRFSKFEKRIRKKFLI